MFTLKIDGEVHLLHASWGGIMGLLEGGFGKGSHIEILPFTAPTGNYMILYKSCDEVFRGTLDDCREWLTDHNAYYDPEYAVWPVK